ncbi:hypothetical protein C4577_06845 [Candidatus Parcubacteria bacterium]|nr:MAG: hypothetical protein C4577_06845 [Candidatus Parcubacteria bacterium]
METRTFTPQFEQKLKNDGFTPSEICKEIASGNRNGQSGQNANTAEILREWTGYSNNAITEGIWNKEKDEIAPTIKQAAITILKPWISQDITELPDISVKEISRKTNLSPEKVINILSKYPISFSLNGLTMQSIVYTPELPKQPAVLDINQARRFGVSAKRARKEGRYFSRPPGGGPAQKVDIKPSAVNSAIRRNALEKTQIKFVSTQEAEIMGYGTMKELNTPPKPDQKYKSVEEIIYTEAEGTKIMKVFEWFQKVGFGKDWIYGQNAAKFAENLVKLSQGKPVDFLIWNCIGFKWFKNQRGEMPTCSINNNLDAAITLYFSQRIQEIAEVLSSIGNPNITILIPSNEAFDSRVWKYLQSQEEREWIINSTATFLKAKFNSLMLPSNASIDFLRWDEYLNKNNATKKPQEYSKDGETAVKSSPNINKIKREGLKSGKTYFAQNGITNIENDVLEERELKYYGVYAGEGVFFEEMQMRGNGIVIVNFEEMRCCQMAYLGSQGNLTIVTPIKNNEMRRYYQWEERQIAKRK